MVIDSDDKGVIYSDPRIIETSRTLPAMNKDSRNQVPLDLHEQLATFCQAVNEDL